MSFSFILFRLKALLLGMGLGLTGLFWGYTLLWAGQAVPEISEGLTLPLSLSEAVTLALENNIDIRVERFNPAIQQARVTQEKGVFDPSLGVDLANRRSRTATATQLAGSEVSDQRTLDLDLSLSQQLQTGGTYTLDFTNNRTNTDSAFATINPSYRSNLILSLRHPLLRNLGISVNTTRIVIAQNTTAISLAQLKQRVIDIIAQVQNAYWELVFRQQDLEVQRQSLRLAENFLAENRARVEAGVLAPIEIVQAQARVASQQVNVIEAEGALRDAEDRLKRLLTSSHTDERWQKTIKPTDMPVFQPQATPLEENLQEALQNRPEIRQAQIDLINRDLLVRFAKNQLLPSVDFRGSIGLNGLDSTYGRALEVLGDTDTYSWEAGVVLEIPLGNRIARGQLTQRRLEFEQAKDALTRLELDVVTQVREAVRRVRVSSERVEATKVATRLAREQLEAEQEKFRVGLSTSFNVLDFQDKLAQAERNELRALVDHVESFLVLEQVKGTLLSVFNIQIPEDRSAVYNQNAGRADPTGKNH